MRQTTFFSSILYPCVPLLLLSLLLVGCNNTTGTTSGINSAESLAEALKTAVPGDVLTIANGTYTDLELVFAGQGTADKPIKLVAQTAGQVFLEGQSNLSLSGEYLHVEGLVFRNGYTPTGEVISFRTAKDELCNNCRVTECVIDNYNPTERFESDYWIALYGKHNRVDHNELIGKRNQGVLLAVRLNDEASRENFHRIDHNYFGYRATLGSNGGETLRIGTSHYCMHNSNTLVESNYFDRCNGEVEIISNKSGQNIFRYNTFTGNLVNPGLIPFKNEGFISREIALEDAGNGVLLPLNTPATDSIRAGIEFMATPENTGATWYERTENEPLFGGGKTIDVAAGTNTIFEAVKRVSSGDIIRLTESGEYLQTKSISVEVPITVTAAAGLSDKPLVTFQNTSLFNIESGRALSLRGVSINGRECRDRPLNSVIRTSRYSMIKNYKLFIEDCDFSDLDINHSFNVLRVYKNTLADSIVLRNSRFENITGSVLALDQETDDIDVYNAQSVVVENCLFDNIGQEAIHVHRGGRDESTQGPMVTIERCTFDDIGGDKRNQTGASIRLHGTQVVRINDCIFDDSKPVELHLVVGDPVVNITNSVFSGGTILTDNDQPYRMAGLRRGLTEPITSIDNRPVGTSLEE